MSLHLSRRTVVAGFGVAGLPWPALAAPVPKFALLIGNQAYSKNVGALKNPVNDIKLVQSVLRGAGFATDNVIALPDAGKGAMERALLQYAERLSKAGPDAIGLFYYCGHGAANAGRGFLIPRDAADASSALLWRQSVETAFVFKQLERFQGVQLALFDCCRNELGLEIAPPPSPGELVAAAPSNSKGLVALRASRPRNMFISYAAWEGETASDGTKAGKNGPYALAFADSVRGSRADTRVIDLFDQVRLRVLATTGETQEPMNLSRMSRAGAQVKPFTPVATARIAPVRRSPPRALVIGNIYPDNARLRLPIAALDADLVAGALKDNDFVVTRAGDLGKAAFFEWLRMFCATLRGTVAVIYFSGYAAGVNGRNFLLPHGLDPRRSAEMERNGIAVMDVVERLLAAKVRAGFIALDCARQIREGFGARSVEVPLEELKEMGEVSANIVVSYSASPGIYAAVQRDRSPYAAALAGELRKPARRSLQDVAKAVKAGVLAATQQQQRPWFQSANRVPIYFRDGRDLNVTEE